MVGAGLAAAAATVLAASAAAREAEVVQAGAEEEWEAAAGAAAGWATAAAPGVAEETEAWGATAGWGAAAASAPLCSAARRGRRVGRSGCPARQCASAWTGRVNRRRHQKLNKHGQKHHLRVFSAPYARRSQVNKGDLEMKGKACRLVCNARAALRGGQRTRPRATRERARARTEHIYSQQEPLLRAVSAVSHCTPPLHEELSEERRRPRPPAQCATRSRTPRPASSQPARRRRRRGLAGPGISFSGRELSGLVMMPWRPSSTRRRCAAPATSRLRPARACARLRRPM